MKKFLLLAALMLGIMSNAKADDAVSATLKVDADLTTATLHVNLTNGVNYVAFQMDVTLPDGWTVESATPVANLTRLVTGDNVTIGGVSTTTEFKLDYNVVNGTNQVRIIGYNLGNNIIQGTSGEEIFTIQLTKTAGTASAVTDWTADFSGVKFVKASDLSAVDMAEISVEGSSSYVLGDVNHSGGVDAVDMALVINYILGKATASDLDLTLANMNGDANVDAIDLALIINKILGK